MREARSRICPVKGMFTGTIGDSLNTEQMHRRKRLTVSSNMPVLNWFMSKADSEVEMTIPEEKDFVAFKNGTPVKLTIKLNNVEAICICTGRIKHSLC